MRDETDLWYRDPAKAADRKTQSHDELRAEVDALLDHLIVAIQLV